MKGLQTNFELKNGAFLLTEGVEKSRNNIWFFCIFNTFRVYCSDFGGHFLRLQQKPVSYIIENATIILGNLRKGIIRYVPNVQVRNIDIGYLSEDRKQYSVMIEYNSVLEDKTEINDVTFV